MENLTECLKKKKEAKKSAARCKNKHKNNVQDFIEMTRATTE